MRSLLQDWVMELPLMQQAVLATGVRGPDGVSREGCHKEVCRYLRYLTLMPAHSDHIENPADKFMSPSLDHIGASLADFVSSHDQYPLHWLMHTIHAYQIIGYKHPDLDHSLRCQRFYLLMCDAFHMAPEKKTDMDNRLSA